MRMLARWGLAILLTMSVTEAASKVLVHGHRGARAMRPENTLPAFEYAIQVGVDVLEMDVSVTKDDVLVVSHNPTLLPSICTGPQPNAVIRELTLDELRKYDCGTLKNRNFPSQQPVPGTRIPTLDEVLTLAAPSKVEFNIETKIFAARPEYTPAPEEFARLMLAEIRKHHLESRVILQSFDFRTLHAMKRLAPEIRLSALYEGAAKDFVAIAREAGAEIVSPHYTLVNKQQVAVAHKAGLQVVPWTANTPKDWDMLLEAKVDAIITDDPAALIAYLKSLGRR
ncbi:MAG: glycerophosphodiester phosphodiesterase [Bryobacteraceae bacterium]